MKKSSLGPSIIEGQIYKSWEGIRESMEFKNRAFKFFNEVYSIRYVDHIDSGDDNTYSFGCTDLVNKVITIALKGSDGKRYSDAHIAQILRHELVHVMLAEGQYLEENLDESLVEWLAKCIGILKEKGLI